eukprot:GHUV01027131.1.p1 GENE.GHUV01027131.1~~GHUV01027131.1.p1  ORF type:complete len:190 (+),score=28.68 GHUV01027131.1:174-743(+)
MLFSPSAASGAHRGPYAQLVIITFMIGVAPYTIRAGQLGATVMVNGFGDLEGAARGSDKPVCQTVVQRAYKFSDIVSFALSVSAMAPDEYTLDSWSYKDPTGNFIPASSDTIARWQRGLQACLSFAVKQGFKQIHILGHWDPVHPVLYRPTTWRNLMDIKPYQKAAGLSYNDVMIQPAITALSAGAPVM